MAYIVKINTEAGHKSLTIIASSRAEAETKAKENKDYRGTIDVRMWQPIYFE